jgi:hypothetical protein
MRAVENLDGPMICGSRIRVENIKKLLKSVKQVR